MKTKKIIDYESPVIKVRDLEIRSVLCEDSPKNASISGYDSSDYSWE